MSAPMPTPTVRFVAFTDSKEGDATIKTWEVRIGDRRYPVAAVNSEEAIAVAEDVWRSQQQCSAVSSRGERCKLDSGHAAAYHRADNARAVGRERVWRDV